MLLGPLRPLWIARGSLLTALSAGCLVGACGGGDDDAQYFTPRKKPSDAGAHASSDDGGPRTGSSGDAGARDASARELEDSELPDAGMVAVPTASREYCDSFAARKVHLWGTIGGARETSRLSAVANELSPERTCRAWIASLPVDTSNPLSSLCRAVTRASSLTGSLEAVA